MNREAMTDAEFITAMQQGLPPLPAPDTIQRGNEGIDPGTWTGWDGPADFAPLPEYPQPADNPQVQIGLTLAEIRKKALGDVAFAAAFMAVGAAGSLLLQGVVA